MVVSNEADDAYANAIAKHYDDRARDADAATALDRHASAAAPVRILNNFVKSCALEATVKACVEAFSDRFALRRHGGGGYGDGDAAAGEPVADTLRASIRLTVVDIALGRGQDCAKWKYALTNAGVGPLKAFYGLDLSAGDVDHATLMAAKFLPGADVVDIRQGDMCQPWAHIATGVADIVSCQLALHYACDRCDRLDAVLAEVARVLNPAGGVFVLSFADGRSIVRRARNAAALARMEQSLAAAAKPRNTGRGTGSGSGSGTSTYPNSVQSHAAIATVADGAPDATGFHGAMGSGEADDVRVTAEYYSVTISRRHLLPILPSPFGCMYTFTLPGCVVGLPESLCSEGAVCQRARRVGFTEAVSVYFDEAARRFLRDPHFARVASMMSRAGGAKTGGPTSLSTVQTVPGALADPGAVDAANLYRLCVLVKVPGASRSVGVAVSAARHAFAM